MVVDAVPNAVSEAQRTACDEKRRENELGVVGAIVVECHGGHQSCARESVVEGYCAFARHMHSVSENE